LARSDGVRSDILFGASLIKVPDNVDTFIPVAGCRGSNAEAAFAAYVLAACAVALFEASLTKPPSTKFAIAKGIVPKTTPSEKHLFPPLPSDHFPPARERKAYQQGKHQGDDHDN
jgi:hypothetical protein